MNMVEDENINFLGGNCGSKFPPNSGISYKSRWWGYVCMGVINV